MIRFGVGFMSKKNILMTGPPKSGKTSMLNEILSFLKRNNISYAGITCPEIIKNGRRYGFKIIDLKTRNEGILASVDEPHGPKVSKYRVNLHNLERIGVTALKRAIQDDSKVIVIDEIGKMELMSESFSKVVVEALDSRKPVLGIIAYKSFNPLINEIKMRSDVDLYLVTRTMNYKERRKITYEITEKILSLIR